MKLKTKINERIIVLDLNLESFTTQSEYEFQEGFKHYTEVKEQGEPIFSYLEKSDFNLSKLTDLKKLLGREEFEQKLRLFFMQSMDDHKYYSAAESIAKKISDFTSVSVLIDRIFEKDGLESASALLSSASVLEYLQLNAIATFSKNKHLEGLLKLTKYVESQLFMEEKTQELEKLSTLKNAMLERTKKFQEQNRNTIQKRGEFQAYSDYLDLPYLSMLILKHSVSNDDSYKNFLNHAQNITLTIYRPQGKKVKRIKRAI